MVSSNENKMETKDIICCSGCCRGVMGLGSASWMVTAVIR